MKSSKQTALALALLMGLIAFALVAGAIALVAWVGGVQLFTSNAGVAAFTGVFFGGTAAGVSAVWVYDCLQ